MRRLFIAIAACGLAARNLPAGDPPPAFPTTQSQVAALWMSDETINTGNDTDVSRVMDQSGHGNHLLVAPGFAAAHYRDADDFGPQRIVFSGRSDQGLPIGMPDYVGGLDQLVSNYTVTLNAPLDGLAEWAVVAWARPRVVAIPNASGDQKPQQLIATGVDQAHRIGFYAGRMEYVDPRHNLAFNANAGNGQRPVVATQEPSCFIVQRGPGNMLETYQGSRSAVNPGLSTGSAASSTLFVGSQPSPAAQNFFSGDLYGLAIFRGSLTPAERSAMVEFGRRKWGTDQRITDGCTVFVGDSVTFGIRADEHRTFPALSRTSERFGAYVNLGVSGAWICRGGVPAQSLRHPSMLAVRDRYAPANLGTTRTALVVCIGINDCQRNHSGRSPDTTDDDALAGAIAQSLISYCQEARATGFSPIYVCTPIDASGTQGSDATLVSTAKVRKRYDLLIPKITSGATLGGYTVIPLHDSPRVGADGSSLDPAYWRHDRTHPGPAGLAEMALSVDQVAGDPVGACCVSGDCFVTQEHDCIAQGGNFAGEGTACDSCNPLCDPAIPCPSGACCLPDGTCAVMAAPACAILGGVFGGDHTRCADVSCPRPVGACCMPDGTCSMLDIGACAARGGTFAGPAISCEAAACPQPTGGCCLSDRSCVVLDYIACAAIGGTFAGSGTECDGLICPLNGGACCMRDGTCSIEIEVVCTSIGGTFAGAGVLCEDAACPQPIGDCCLNGGICRVLPRNECMLLPGARFTGVNSDCVACQPLCTADFNGDFLVNPDDLGDYITCYFSNPPCLSADINADSLVNADDLGDFITAYFIGCE